MEHKHFDKFIETLRFPNFRNMQENAQINFEFPITFFVGKNGAGKSSALQALYGCPENSVISDFWFETQTDPILDNSSRSRFIYGYEKNGVYGEVLYQRAPRDGNLDYWETARPQKSLLMPNEVRFSPVEMGVLYLDFRMQLNAFDKFFNVLSFNGIKKQDYLRKYSKYLNLALNTDSEVSFYSRYNEPKVRLEDNLVNKINGILGKNYQSIEIIKHNFYKDLEYSIRLISDSFNYTEAFAGSGESAIILLLYKISLLDSQTLIILDEPETSLHPGAQQRLIDYFLDLVISEKHQIVMSTHSPELIAEMPASSIVGFYSNEQTGKFYFVNGLDYKSAFIELEVDKSMLNHKIIFYEDKLVEKILQRVIKTHQPGYSDLLTLKISTGGSAEIHKRCANLVDLPNIFVIFDGDQLVDEEIDTSKFTVSQSKDISFLKGKVFRLTKQKIQFSVDGGNASNAEQKIEKHIGFLNYYKNNVFYLPEMIPEDIIWDQSFAKQKLALVWPEKENIDFDKDNKENLKNLCMELYDSIENHPLLIDEFILNWVQKKDDNFVKITKILDTIVER